MPTLDRSDEVDPRATRQIRASVVALNAADPRTIGGKSGSLPRPGVQPVCHYLAEMLIALHDEIVEKTMVHHPTNRTTPYFAWWAAASAVAAVIIGMIAAGSEGSTRDIALVTAVLFAGIAAANLVALARLRRSSTRSVTGQ